MHSPTPETTEECFCKELELDRKDAECEFLVTKMEVYYLKQVERTTDVVHFRGFVCAFRAHTFIQQRDKHSTMQQLTSGQLEALPVPKFIYRQDCLNFTEVLVADERDYAISGDVTPRAVDELIAAGNLGELDELLQNASDIDCN